MKTKTKKAGGRRSTVASGGGSRDVGRSKTTSFAVAGGRVIEVLRQACDTLGPVARRTWKKLRQARRRKVAGRLKVAQTVALGGKRFLTLVEVDGVRMLVGGGEAVTVMTQLPAPAPGSSGKRGRRRSEAETWQSQWTTAHIDRLMDGAEVRA